MPTLNTSKVLLAENESSRAPATVPVAMSGDCWNEGPQATTAVLLISFSFILLMWLQWEMTGMSTRWVQIILHRPN